MVVSWCFLVPIAILAARFGKTKIGAKWFPIHRWINILVFLLTTVGLILICLFKENVVFTNNYFAHPFIGSVLYGLMVIQIFFGWYINKVWNPTRTSIPWHDKVHWGLGYLLVILGFINTVLTFTLSVKGYVIGAIVVYALFFVIFIVMQLKYGQQHHQ
jgi:Eukaryotic cytochrome b561